MFLFYYKYSVEIGGFIMPVSPVNTSQVQYVQTFEPVNVKEYPDRYVYTYEEPGTTGKKIGVGAASYFIPGLGQAINGQWGKATGFFAGYSVGSAILGKLVYTPLFKKFGEIVTKEGIKESEIMNTAMKAISKSFMGIAISSLLLTAVKLWSTVDGVKNAKSKRDIVVMKEQVAAANANTNTQPAIAEAQT